MQQNSARELWLSLAAILLITLAYLVVVFAFEGVPAASGFFGHTIGILGFLLMLMTETLYSIRKRSRRASWGRTASWLQFHIFTGLVGPYMVLLHSSWKFNGLAGVVTLLTLVVVASGFVGRYIYTAVPRTADGVELKANQLTQQIAEAELELKQWLDTQGPALSQLAARFSGEEQKQSEGALFWGHALYDWRLRFEWWLRKRGLDAAARAKANQLEKLTQRRATLRRQVQTLAASRRLLAVWHSVHIPIGMTLFAAAFVHIGAAIYYATLLH